VLGLLENRFDMGSMFGALMCVGEINDFLAHGRLEVLLLGPNLVLEALHNRVQRRRLRRGRGVVSAAAVRRFLRRFLRDLQLRFGQVHRRNEKLELFDLCGNFVLVLLNRAL